MISPGSRKPRLRKKGGRIGKAVYDLHQRVNSPSVDLLFDPGLTLDSQQILQHTENAESMVKRSDVDGDIPGISLMPGRDLFLNDLTLLFSSTPLTTCMLSMIPRSPSLVQCSFLCF